MKRHILWFFGLLFAAVFSSFAGQGAAESPFRIIESAPMGWSVSYLYRPIPSTSTVIDGTEHLVFTGALAEEGKEGEPQLPTEILALGIPFGFSVAVELIDPVYEILENQRVAPVPKHQTTDENEAVEIRVKSQPAYAQNRFYPSSQVEVGKPYTIRQQRMVSVRLSPCQYNPTSRILKRLLSSRLVIRLLATGNDLSLEPTSTSDPYYEDVYKSLLSNYEEAKQWRRSSYPSIGGGDPTRDWFELGRTYYNIKVAEDGWYRISKADLIAAGANPSQIDPVTLRIYGNGLEIPIVVRPDTSVEFYGFYNYGDSTYIDFYTDTSHYWLTWGGAAGARFVSSPQPPGVPVLDIRSARITRHFEPNLGYYQGTTQTEIIQNDRVPGEGWRWELFYPNTTITKVVTLDSVFVGSDSVANVRIRLFGTTVDSPGLDHRAKFWINDSLIGEASFEARTGVTYTAVFPARWLANGSNALKVQSIPTVNPINQFYLDWFEIDYARKLSAQNSQLLFDSPQSGGSDPALFTLSGFSSAQIEVFDLGAARLLTGGTVTGDSTSGFMIAFRDTCSLPRKYLVVSSNGPKPVPPLVQKEFVDIRSNPMGADYIIITHKNFITSALQLASHRQVTNAVRTKVIDIQDIYDEFNYGVEDWTIVKAFLRYTYQQWPAPSPSSLLFFGDASWDNHNYLPTTVKKNYVPAYGLPAGDNWFGCLDSATQGIPEFFIGRIPVEDSVQAQRVIAKLMGYDSYTLGEWNKSFLFITGGTSTGEQSTFNSRSETSINTYVSPPPIGGTPYRVYKSTQAVIDGENKALLRALVKQGLLFMNFLGHSGGRIWGVDIGTISDLENTNGKLPFISSVSCNVGAFAEPSNNVLGEDFVMSDNRGAIATWASSSLGYPTPGWILMNNFLSSVIVDSMRDFGELTSTARYKLWQASQGDPIVRAMVNLNPLIGDPLSRLALPRMPDFNVETEDIALNTSVPTPNDSSLSVKLRVHNWGLVPLDSVEVSLGDLYAGQMLPILDSRLAPTRHHDSLIVTWDALDKVGRHTIVASLDPQNVIPEVNELNNSTSSDQYIYANLLAVVMPMNSQVMAPGPQTLIVTSPNGRDSVGFSYFFELDTVATFDSPSHISSGPISPEAVKGEWTTSPLENGRVYFWRARTVEDTLLGNWVTSSFSTANDAPALPRVRLRESERKQFLRDYVDQAAATDSGVTIAPNAPIQLFCRSLSYRANLNIDYYSVIRLNDQTMTGLWWVLGRSFMVLRVNEFTGTSEFRAFDVAGQAAQRDSMTRFIKNTPAGSYLAISVIFDGQTNVNESLYVAIETLGSTMIRSAANGKSWVLIGRKGYPMAALESLTNDSAMVSLQVPNYYSFGSGSIVAPPVSVPMGWDSLRWEFGGSPGITSARLALLGVRDRGGVDTLRIFPQESTSVRLASVNLLTSGPTYTSFQVAGLLASNDANYTPVLRKWQIDISPGPDLAVSSRTVGMDVFTVERGTLFNLPVTVYNIGFLDADSARIAVSVYDKFNKARPIANAMLDSIPVNGFKSSSIPITTTEFSRRVVLQVSVAPSKKGKDIVPDNNVAYLVLNVTGIESPPMQMYADGVPLMDGDYVSAKPTIVVRPPHIEGGAVWNGELFVDNVQVGMPMHDVKAKRNTATTFGGEDMAFALDLAEGRHELNARLISHTSFGERDTVGHTVTIIVSRESRILKVFNYPNPFSQETYFTFTLTGLTVPEELSIRVFTVTGRRIREIDVPQTSLQIGFNKVVWDGRDNDGDEIANGYYFYQLAMKGSEGKTVTAIEKLVKLR